MLLTALAALVAGCHPADEVSLAVRPAGNTEDDRSSDHARSPAVHWGYAADDGPARWARLDRAWSLCDSGQRQSPIDLSDAVERAIGRVIVQTPGDRQVGVVNQQNVISALDNGHTIQVNALTGEAMIVAEKRYSLVQFHFHAPSEHTMNGHRFPMEIHFVHATEYGALAVIGILAEPGAENPGIAPLWAQLRTTAGLETRIALPSGFADALFPARSAYFHYSGSLTTPPCTEDVTWFVAEEPTHLSRGQIATFTAVYDHNSRPVQPRLERGLYIDSTPAIEAH